MTTSDFTKNDTPKYIYEIMTVRKKAPQKMAHPVPAYMVVTPPLGHDSTRFAIKNLNALQRSISYSKKLEQQECDSSASS